MKSQEKRKGEKKVFRQEISWETKAKCMSIVIEILVMQRNTRHQVEIISTQVILLLGFISTPMKRLCLVHKSPTFVKFGRINCRQSYPQLLMRLISELKPATYHFQWKALAIAPRFKLFISTPMLKVILPFERRPFKIN